MHFFGVRMATIWSVSSATTMQRNKQHNVPLLVSQEKQSPIQLWGAKQALRGCKFISGSPWIGLHTNEATYNAYDCKPTRELFNLPLEAHSWGHSGRLIGKLFENTKPWDQMWMTTKTLDGIFVEELWCHYQGCLAPSFSGPSEWRGAVWSMQVYGCQEGG